MLRVSVGAALAQGSLGDHVAAGDWVVVRHRKRIRNQNEKRERRGATPGAVGERGFEPPTSASRTLRANRAALLPAFVEDTIGRRHRQFPNRDFSLVTWQSSWQFVSRLRMM